MTAGERGARQNNTDHVAGGTHTGTGALHIYQITTHTHTWAARVFLKGKPLLLQGHVQGYQLPFIMIYWLAYAERCAGL